MTTCVLCHSLVATTYRVDSDLVATFCESLERGSNQVRNRLTCTPKAEKSCGLREPRSARQEPSIPRPLAYARGGVFLLRGRVAMNSESWSVLQVRATALFGVPPRLQCAPKRGVFCRSFPLTGGFFSGRWEHRNEHGCSAGRRLRRRCSPSPGWEHRNEHGCLAGSERFN